jgi:glycine cleavage system H protein
VSSEIPADLVYTEAHEWVRTTEDGIVRIGVTDHAQQQLGDVVFVQLPDVGDTFSAGDSMGEVESTKSVSDIYVPVGGEIVAVNEKLDENPELVNSSPYGDGWIVELRLAEGGEAQLESLLGPDAYQQLVASS